MPLSFPEIAQFCTLSGAVPLDRIRRPRRLDWFWTKLIPLAESGSIGTRADLGVCPTMTAEPLVLGWDGILSHTLKMLT